MHPTAEIANDTKDADDMDEASGYSTSNINIIK